MSQTPDFRLLFEATPGLYLILAPDLTIVAVNDAYARATMTERAAIIGKGLFEVFPDNPDDPAADGVGNLRASLQRVLTHGRPDAMAVQKYDIRRPDGSFEERFWSPLNSPVFDASGQLAWIIHRVEDVTALVKLQAEGAERDRLAIEQQRIIEQLRSANAALSRSRQQLFHAQKMEAIGNLTGGMAHDFNNLLAVIIGNLEELAEIEPDNEAVRELAGEALDAGFRGAELTRRLLAFARRQPLQPQRIDVNELIGGMTKLLARTLGENIEINFEAGADLWPVVVDPAQLEASIANLANNARDAMPQGGRLSIITANRHLDEDYVSLYEGVAAGDYVVIKVNDNGMGMPADIVAKIFEPFFTTKEQGKGTGLGLSMVFGFMKQSGGHINVYSEPGAGTIFRLYLPRARDTADAAPVRHRTEPPKGHESVLVVEDNPAMRRLVVRQFRDLGYQVWEADNAAGALAVLEQQQIDLLFTDVMMPGGMSGLQLAQAAMARWPKLRVALTSGFPDVRVGDSGAASPQLRILSKPYRREDLAKLVRETLDA